MTRPPLRLSLRFWSFVDRLYCRWWFRLRCVGPCTIPAEGPAIVVANHTSTIDPLLLIATNPGRPISFLIAKEYHELPIIHRFTRMIECIPVKRDGFDVAATRAAIRHLQAGKLLGIFPEGRIARGRTLEPKLGMAMLALHARVPVIPAHISGTRFSGHAAWPFFQPQHARVRYGPAIDLSGYYGRRRDPGVLEEAAEVIMGSIRDLAAEQAGEATRAEGHG